MAAPVKIDISDLIDNSRITSLQAGIFMLCSVCLFTVGFDWQALGYMAPAIVDDFNIPNSALGPVFGAANVGFLIGAAPAGMLADAIGRRPVLIGATRFLPASPFSRRRDFFRGTARASLPVRDRFRLGHPDRHRAGW